MSDRTDLIEQISNLAVVHGKVTLASGKEADYYGDMRRVTLDGVASPIVGRVMNDLVADWEFGVVGGMTVGADPVATAVRHARAAAGGRLDAIVIRKQAKANGMQRRIEGAAVAGRRVLVVEDGPTLTHGGMPFGAGTLAARRFGASELVDPRPWLVGSLKGVFDSYPGIGAVLPAMGYGPDQIRDLEATMNAVPCDVVVSGTPIDISRVVRTKRPVVRVRYAHADHGSPTLESLIPAMLPVLD